MPLQSEAGWNGPDTLLSAENPESRGSVVHALHGLSILGLSICSSLLTIKVDIRCRINFFVSPSFWFLFQNWEWRKQREQRFKKRKKKHFHNLIPTFEKLCSNKLGNSLLHLKTLQYRHGHAYVYSFKWVLLRSNAPSASPWLRRSASSKVFTSNNISPSSSQTNHNLHLKQQYVRRPSSLREMCHHANLWQPHSSAVWVWIEHGNGLKASSLFLQALWAFEAGRKALYKQTPKPHFDENCVSVAFILMI